MNVLKPPWYAIPLAIAPIALLADIALTGKGTWRRVLTVRDGFAPQPAEPKERMLGWIEAATRVPGLLQVQRIDGLHHYLVLDQDEDFGEFLRASGARSMRSMPVSLDRAVNGFLAKNHAAPIAA